MTLFLSLQDIFSSYFLCKNIFFGPVMEKIVLFINKFESQDLLNLFFDEESPSPAATPSSAVATTAVSDSAAGGAGVGQMAEPATVTMTAEDEAEAAAEMDQPGQEESDGSDTD